MARSSLGNSSAAVRHWSRTILVGSSHEAQTSFLVTSFVNWILSPTKSILCLSVVSQFSPFLFLHHFSSFIGIDSSTTRSKPPIDQSHPEMTHRRQQPYDYYLADPADDYANFGDGRPPKRRSPNLTDNRQRPSLEGNTYTQQSSSQYLNPPRTNKFGQTSFDFCPPNGSNQAPPPFDARSNIPMQNNYQDLAGNPFQLADNGNSSNQAGTPGYVHNWTGRLPLQSLFDGTAPPIDQSQSGYPFDDDHPAGTETDWLDHDWGSEANSLNLVPFQPRYGINPAPVPSQNTCYPPTNNALGALGGTFTDEEIEAAYGCKLSTQTINGNDPVQESADYSQYPQGASKSGDVDSADHGVRLALRKAAHQRAQDEAPRPVSKPPPVSKSQPVSRISRPLKLRPVRAVPLDPGVHAELASEDNPLPRKLKKQIADPDPLQDPLTLSLMTDFATDTDTLKFLDARPHPLDASQIPVSACQSALLVMGIFDRVLSMSYVHGALPSDFTPEQKLDFCTRDRDYMQERLAEKGNAIISIIQNSRRWTAILPRSTTQKNNDVASLLGWKTRTVSEPSCNYTKLDTEAASLCVAAAALTTFLAIPCRPVFKKETYDRIRTGAHTISRYPVIDLPSGVAASLQEELYILMQVPPAWETGRLPLMQIAGRLVGDSPQVMSVDSG
jgi:hypothetical protein